MLDPSDEDLVAAYLERGDERAFGRVLARHQERIFGYLVGMVRDRAVAADLFQETFLRAIQAMQAQRGGYEQQGRWLAWIMRIARNAALDHLRSQKKFADVSSGGDDEGPSFFDRLPDDAPDASSLLSRADLVQEVAAAIEQLPPEQREVVLMRHQGDLTFREIAELTDVSINTALGRMRYALINLRKLLEPEWFADAPSDVQPRTRNRASARSEE
ncbi:MAG TPA: sigma-70 family RNA polymerase sigma factor [Rhodothermales bacterium]|nr:sigma-70 family RNA polymerase sigma factor [Rhodothermales bacterium]